MRAGRVERADPRNASTVLCRIACDGTTHTAKYFYCGRQCCLIIYNLYHSAGMLVCCFNTAENLDNENCTPYARCILVLLDLLRPPVTARLEN